MARLFLGGAGFGVKLLYDLVPPGTDPLGPDNVLVFAPGPLTGSGSPCSSRIAVTGRSPLTGAVGMATSGGYFPAELKFAGFDMVVIQGQAREPTTLVISDGSAHLRSATKLWGTSTMDCQEFLKEELRDHNYRVACIGQAGEQQSRIAGIVNERRAMGRKGMGAVMGAKRLKAIAVRGHSKVPIADAKAFASERHALLERFKKSPTLYSGMGKFGTSTVVDMTCELGIFPAKNYSATGKFAPVDEIGSDAQGRDILRRNPCQACPVACSQVRLARSGAFPGSLTEGPEFESSWALSGSTGVTDRSALYLADRLCDDYGLDTISVGATIAFAMELFERGIISATETEGLEVRFGNHAVMIELIHRMAHRIGFGAILADGALEAARQIGRGSGYYAMHVKGLELPGYDVRGAKAHGLNYSTAYVGADHNRGYASQEIFGGKIPVSVDRFALEGKAELCKWNQVMKTALCDCPTFCAFLLSDGVAFLSPTEAGISDELSERRVVNLASLITAVTGPELSPGDLIDVGERVNTLARSYNLLNGFTREHDYLPARLTEETIPDGPSKGHLTSREDQDWLLDQYYKVYGYDLRGVPTKATLRRLQIEQVADDLSKALSSPG
jgi:aldehyde:ferredoxin oxidoreductase